MLAGVAAGTRSRFNMPGHKGKAAYLPERVNVRDITEVPGADSLYCPEGVIQRSQRLYADAIGARSARYLVNGSTCGVETAILSAIGPGDKILVARDLHLSAVHAFILADAKPVFIVPKPSAGSLPSVVTPQQVERAIRRHTDAKAIYVTYPNYYGECVDLETITAMAHEAGMRVICDAAHAAAFDFSTLLPASPSRCGCDLWATSLHKTLPANNQCAALLVGRGCLGIPETLVQSRLNWLQTTSPSYLLLASCEFATAIMMQEGADLVSRAVQQLEVATRQLERMGFRVLSRDVAPQTGAYDRDILRLVIDVSGRGMTGLAAAREMARQGTYVEGADLSNLILICSPVDVEDDLATLVGTMQTLKGGLYTIERPLRNQDLWNLGESEFVAPIRAAAMARRESVPISKCDGRISAACIGLYPPGVPIYMPGQRLSAEKMRTLERLRKEGYGTFGFSETVEVAAMEPPDGYNARPVS